MYIELGGVGRVWKRLCIIVCIRVEVEIEVQESMGIRSRVLFFVGFKWSPQMLGVLGHIMCSCVQSPNAE